jgi:hypothetical protein
MTLHRADYRKPFFHHTGLNVGPAANLAPHFVATAKRARPMRFLVLAFGCLACFKVWTQDRLVRAAMGDALIQAYRERAQQVCARETSKTGLPAQWPASSTAEITIGSQIAGVMLWDFDNPLWDVRYRHPHLVLTAAGPRKLRCSYDLNAGVAFVQVF